MGDARRWRRQRSWRAALLAAGFLLAPAWAPERSEVSIVLFADDAQTVGDPSAYAAAADAFILPEHASRWGGDAQRRRRFNVPDGVRAFLVVDDHGLVLRRVDEISAQDLRGLIEGEDRAVSAEFHGSCRVASVDRVRDDASGDCLSAAYAIARNTDDPQAQRLLQARLLHNVRGLACTDWGEVDALVDAAANRLLTGLGSFNLEDAEDARAFSVGVGALLAHPRLDRALTRACASRRHGVREARAALGAVAARFAGR